MLPRDSLPNLRNLYRRPAIPPVAELSGRSNCDGPIARDCERQMVEIARAVRLKAKVNIFDEPTATLTPEEKRHLFALIPAAEGSSIDYLHQSRVGRSARNLRSHHDLARRRACCHGRREVLHARRVGRSLTSELYGRASGTRLAPGAKVLSVQNLSMQNQVRNTSFSIFAGQVTGVFGLVGSGRTETAKIVAGVVRRDAFHGGDVRFGDRSVRYRTPRAAVGEGMVYVTEDRKGDGLFETMSVADNIYIGQIAGRESGGILTSRSEKKALAARSTQSLNIRALSGDARISNFPAATSRKP
jgi:simple sugar transport system ATP-binding protein